MKYEVIRSNGMVSLGIIEADYKDLLGKLRGSGLIVRKYKGEAETTLTVETIENLKDPFSDTAHVPIHSQKELDKPAQVKLCNLGIVEVDIDPETPLQSAYKQHDTPILGFKNTVFTNMYPCSIVINHSTLGTLKFRCVESAYMACKCADVRDIKQFTCMDGYRAKQEGKTVKLADGWEGRKLKVMEYLLTKKFQIPELKVALLATGDGYLEETNYWHDNFWGNCSCAKCTKFEGANNLGKLLMKVRAELQEVN